VLAANRGMKRRGFQEDTGFEIHLDVPQFKGGIGDLREQLISAGWGTLTAHIDGQGYGACELDAMGIRQKQIKTGKQFSHLAGVKLKIGILIDKKEQLRDKGILSKGNLQKILPEWGGVQIRYNGFRVYPYGDDDWLDIDHDRGLRRGTTEGQLSSFAQKLKGVDPGRALLSLLSMRSYVGTVEVDSKAKGFELKVNREGFLQSEAVGELKEFVRFCIDWSTIYRDYFLKQQDKSEAEGARQHLQEVLKKEVEPEHLVESAVEYIQKEIKSVSSLLPPQERRAISTSFRNATTAILKHDKAKKEELHHLRLIASTSTLLLIFSHEVKSLLGTLEGSTSSLRQIEGKLVSKDAETVAGIRAALSESKLRFSELIDMTSLIGVDSKSATPERLALGERVRDAKKCFKLILNGYDIQVDESLVPNSVKVGPMLEAELYAILLNVLSNSIKSVIAAGGAKEIQVEAIASGGKNLINIRDTGIGLAPSHFNDVFIPFVADPDGRLYANLNKKLNAQDRYIVGTGSGLGLAIIKEIVEFRKGSITFREPHGKWKAHLEIILP
jgi:signal transduction histidine kinase